MNNCIHLTKREKKYKTIQHNDKFTWLNDKKRLPGNRAQPSTASCTRPTYSSQEFRSTRATLHRPLQQVGTLAHLRHWEVPRDSSTPPRCSPVPSNMRPLLKEERQLKKTVNQQTTPDPKIQVQNQKQHQKQHNKT